MTALDDQLARIRRGPCGGWHWTGGDHRIRHAWRCRTCEALGQVAA